MFFEPGDDMGAVDESGPGQWRRIEVRVTRREVSAVIDELAEKLQLSEEARLMIARSTGPVFRSGRSRQRTVSLT